MKTNDLEQSVAFYSAMFDAKPTRLEKDYAKWLLDDPCAHVSVSTHGGKPGFDHAGISIDTREDLDATEKRLRPTGAAAFSEEETTCCYARSNKHWIADPQGVSWELFQTFQDAETYGAEPDREIAQPAPTSLNDSCCAP